MGGCACLGAGGIWETSVPSPQFFCEPMTTLKKREIGKMKREIVSGL